MPVSKASHNFECDPLAFLGCDDSDERAHGIRHAPTPADDTPHIFRGHMQLDDDRVGPSTSLTVTCEGSSTSDLAMYSMSSFMLSSPFLAR